jgi:hypothetical protein
MYFVLKVITNHDCFNYLIIDEDQSDLVIMLF